MAGKDPSIYNDRSAIGTPEELDEYGVWVKSEPEDLLSGISLPETEELPDFDELAADFSGRSGANLPDTDGAADFDDVPTGNSGAAASSEPPAADLSTRLLMRIADELSSIKKELSSLKTELSTVKDAHLESQETRGGAGFFGEEDDEKIALTGDELNNILSTAGLTGTAGAEEMPEPAAAVPETAENTEIAEVPLEPATAVDDALPPDETFSLEREAETVALDDITAPEPEIPAADGLTLEPEIPVDDMLTLDNAVSLDSDALLSDEALEQISDDFDISLDLTENFDLTEAVDAPLNAKDPGSFQAEAGPKQEVPEDLTLPAEFAVSEELTLPEGENTAYVEEDPLAPLSADGSGEELDLSGAIIEEPDLSAGITENPLEEPSFDNISLDDDAFGNISIDMDMEEGGGEAKTDEKDDLSVEDSFNIDADNLIEIPFLDSLLAETPAGTQSEESVPAAASEEAPPVPADESVPFDDSTLSTGDDDVSFSEYLGLDGGAETPSGQEAVTESAVPESAAGEDSAPAFPEIPRIDAEPVSGAAAGVGAIPPDLKQELKTVLSYMDQLLESLPEEKIEEFAKSKYFDTYKKLFEELGIG
jgi:hypothetical protein